MKIISSDSVCDIKIYSIMYFSILWHEYVWENPSVLADYFKIIFFNTFFQKQNQSVKRFGSRSGPREYQYKLFAYVIRRPQKLSLAEKELRVYSTVYVRVKFEKFFHLQLYAQEEKSTMKISRGVTHVLLGNINLEKADLVLV